MVLTRAFACATPVVASDIEGYARSPTTTRPGSSSRPAIADALAGAIVELLQDEERRRALGIAPRKAAEPYSWERIGRSLVEIYERLDGAGRAVRAAA